MYIYNWLGRIRLYFCIFYIYLVCMHFLFNLDKVPHLIWVIRLLTSEFVMWLVQRVDYQIEAHNFKSEAHAGVAKSLLV